jgi:TatD DNase family protein
MFIDSHAHLDSPEFREDAENVLTRAREAGVSSIMTIGCVQKTIESLTGFMEILDNYENIYGAIGVHPHDASSYSEVLEIQINDLMSHPKMLGWGEIGLDFHYNNSPQEQQIEAFRKQLRSAYSVSKPVVIHCRNAEQLTCQILEEEFSNGPGGIIHCFTGDLDMAERCMKLGFYISFGGILTFPKAVELRESVLKIPTKKLLIETDAPYLAPVPFRGKRNEPAYLPKVADTLAQILGLTSEEVAIITRNNFTNLFGL